MSIEILERKNEGAVVRLNGSTVQVTKIKNGAYRQFLLRWKVGRKSMRRVFAKRPIALEEARRIVGDLARAEGERTAVHSDDIIFLRECLRKAGGKSRLLEAVNLYVQKHPIGAGRKSVTDVTDEFMDWMRERQEVKKLSKAYINDLNSLTGQMRNWMGNRAMAEVTHKDMQEFISKGVWSPYTYRNFVRAWQAVEKFAKRSGYLGKDFESITTDLALPPTDRRIVPIFKPYELVHLLILAKKDEIPYLATMCFAGSRRAEFQRMTAEHLRFDEHHAVIDETIAKTAARRTLDITDQVKAWLSVAALPETGRLTCHRRVAAISRDVSRLGILGLEWKKNVLRHSFCSYHYAKYRNANETSYLAGNSPKTLQRYYRALVTSAEADEWFNITPQYVRDYASENGLSALIKW
jgi:hypothetical protein